MNKGTFPHNKLWFVALLALAALTLFWPRLVTGEQGDGPSFPRSSMVIESAAGEKIPFDIEVATTPEQEAYGLMFRRSLPDHYAMLFVSASPRIASMWMKNTYIPLDMLFVRADGAIAKIVTNAQPFDLTPISSDEPILGVIEIKGGEASRLGLRVGDKVRHPVFSGP